MQSTDILKNRPPATQQFLKKIQQVVHAVVPEADVILYGSRARGDARPVSDWDFLILVDQPVDRNLDSCLSLIPVVLSKHARQRCRAHLPIINTPSMFPSSIDNRSWE